MCTQLRSRSTVSRPMLFQATGYGYLQSWTRELYSLDRTELTARDGETKILTAFTSIKGRNDTFPMVLSTHDHQSNLYAASRLASPFPKTSPLSIREYAFSGPKDRRRRGCTVCAGRQHSSPALFSQSQARHPEAQRDQDEVWHLAICGPDGQHQELRELARQTGRCCEGKSIIVAMRTPKMVSTQSVGSKLTGSHRVGGRAWRASDGYLPPSIQQLYLRF